MNTAYDERRVQSNEQRLRPSTARRVHGASRAEVHDFSRASDLSRATSLMGTYSDTPMDFADATLLLLADSLDVDDILTLDRRGFSTFRTRGGGPSAWCSTSEVRRPRS